MKKKQCVIIGAGALGLGFLGPELHSDYHLTYADIPEKRQLLRHMAEHGWYEYNETGPALRSTRIEGVNGVLVTEKAQFQQALQESDVIFTAVGEPNLHKVAPSLAEALAERTPSNPLRVLCCENGIDIAQKCRHHVDEALEQKSGNKLLVGDTVMGRMCKVVSPPESDMQSVIPSVDWAVCGEPFFGLPVSRQIMDDLDEPGEAFQLMSPAEFAAQEDVKMLAHNGLHGFLAFLGTLGGAEYFCELKCNQKLMNMADQLLRQEATPALMKKHGAALDRNFFRNYCPTILRRITCPGLHDPLSRGARGAMRKLQPWERLIGSLRAVAEQGIEPVMFATGIAAAIHLARRRGETDLDFSSVLTEHCRLDTHAEQDLIQLCKKRHRWLTQEFIASG